MFRTHALIALVFLVSVLATPNAFAKEQIFQEFSCDLPEGWDGTERVGFLTRDREEYMLTLGLKDEAEENYLAFISLYLLPNKPGKNSEDSAKALAKEQADASEPVQKGPYWVFTGNPRDKTLPGLATTYVTSNKDSLLIIIAKDPSMRGADKIIQSVRPQSTRAKALLTE
ncbi:MAG: protoporphyrinogen oxidase [Desulfovibrionaceae bacterium]|nr:protoporphyrinogen oxidase [Desulfovibrionaceae bacterium]